MLKKITILAVCAVLGLGCGAVAWADLTEELPSDDEKTVWEIHGVLKNETALFTQGGETTNRAASTTSNRERGGGILLKMENSLNLHINRSLTESTSLHAQLNLMYEAEGLEGERGHDAYSQNDYLRELYLDTTLGSVDLRLGKQQEVWGTADGIKLLDILNPTDYREFVQNTMSDARIPVWMLKASGSVGGTGHLQFLLAQPKENHIPGLNANGDPDRAFIMKGVDTITGQGNGFLNMVPQLGKVASTFHTMATGFGVPGLVAVSGFNPRQVTVQDFVAGTPGLGAHFQAGAMGTGLCNAGGAACLNQITQRTNQNKTLLIDGSNWDNNNPNSAFEYMSDATFATFNTFVNAKSAYRRDYPEDYALNVGLRYKNSVGGNFRYSLNFLNHYDPNPYVVTSWINGQGGALTTERVVDGGKTTLHLRDAVGSYYGMVDPNTGAIIDRQAILLFTEKLKRIHSLGSAFDTSVESDLLGQVVLRGEVVYQMDTQSPVVDRTLLSQGDLVGGLQSKDTDMVKYALGAEFIVMTNLTMGAQFIQFIHLDYVDDPGRYTADRTVMSLSNGLLKTSQYKEFASLFFSKPFGAEQQGRINNLTMVEERGGWWNRLDGEWKLDDNWMIMAEWNQYWGNEETMMGQFHTMSNMQVGIKHVF